MPKSLTEEDLIELEAYFAGLRMDRHRDSRLSRTLELIEGPRT